MMFEVYITMMKNPTNFHTFTGLTDSPTGSPFHTTFWQKPIFFSHGTMLTLAKYWVIAPLPPILASVRALFPSVRTPNILP